MGVCGFFGLKLAYYGLKPHTKYTSHWLRLAAPKNREKKKIRAANSSHTQKRVETSRKVELAPTTNSHV